MKNLTKKFLLLVTVIVLSQTMYAGVWSYEDADIFTEDVLPVYDTLIHQTEIFNNPVFLGIKRFGSVKDRELRRTYVKEKRYRLYTIYFYEFSDKDQNYSLRSIAYDGFIHEVVESRIGGKPKSLEDMKYYTMGVIPFVKIVKLLGRNYNSPIIKYVGFVNKKHKRRVYEYEIMEEVPNKNGYKSIKGKIDAITGKIL